jgi:formylglycine-generating enzyme required for sulfatase activity
MERHDMRITVVDYTKSVSLLIVISCALLVSCGKPDRHGMAIIKAAGKKFVMGQNGLANAKPMEITLDHNFYMDRTEVTQTMFKGIMGNNPSFFKGDSTRPVENVSFIEAAGFCNRRSVAEGLAPCYSPASWSCDRTKNGYRLPNEVEWEFACRAGKNTRFSWGTGVSPRHCWFKGNSGAVTHPVATAKPNSLGLYDMIGNVWEWCDDRYTPSRDSKSLTHWELGPKTLRGGSWSSAPDLLGSAVRDGGDPQGKSNGVGFRCVRNLK